MGIYSKNILLTHKASLARLTLEKFKRLNKYSPSTAYQYLLTCICDTSFYSQITNNLSPKLCNQYFPDSSLKTFEQVIKKPLENFSKNDKNILDRDGITAKEKLNKLTKGLYELKRQKFLPTSYKDVISQYETKYHNILYTKNTEPLGVTSPGFLYRKTNEDGLFYTDSLSFVCDGVSKRSDGDMASLIATTYLKENPERHTAPLKELLKSIHNAVLASKDTLRNGSSNHSQYNYESLFNKFYKKRSEDSKTPTVITTAIYNELINRLERKNTTKYSCTGAIARKNKENNTLELGFVGDCQGYVIQNGEIIFDSTMSNFRSCFPVIYVQRAYCDPKYLNNINRAAHKVFSPENFQRKMSPFTESRTCSAFGAEKAVFCPETFTVKYTPNSNTYLILLSDGLSDEITSTDLAYLAKHTHNSEELIEKLDIYKQISYATLAFEYLHERKNKKQNADFYNQLHETIHSDKKLERLYIHYASAHPQREEQPLDIDTHNEWKLYWTLESTLETFESLTSFLNNEENPNSNPLLQFQDTLIRKYAQIKKELEKKLDLPSITTYEQAYEYFSNCKQAMQQYNRVSNFVKPDNYTAFVKEL